MNGDARIRITERSLDLGESTIPTRSEDFTEVITERLSESEGVGAAEVTLQFTEDQSLDDAIAFFDGVDAAEGLRADVSEVTLVVRQDDG